MTSLSPKYIRINAQRDTILKYWLEKENIRSIVHSLGIRDDEFLQNFAVHMFEFFLKIVKDEDKPGDCPALRSLIGFFHSKRISARDLFLLCTGLKDSLVDFYLTDAGIRKEAEADPMLLHHLFEETASILNENFSNILYEYTGKLFQKQEELNRYSKAIEEHVILSRTDKYGRINHVSDSFCKISEYSREELMDKPHNIVRHPDMPKEIFKDMWDTIQAGKVWEGKIKNSTKNHGFFVANTTVMPIINGEGEIDGYVSIRHDITDQINANIDSLTKAYNRRKFEQDFATQYLKAITEGLSLSLIIMDLDNFKEINDSHGHMKGDEVLVKVAETVKEHIRKNDLFARWGGEEFVILMVGAAENVAVEKAEAIRQAIEGLEFELLGRVSCSFGVAQLKKEESREDFIKRTDDFLYKAKREGKNRVISS